MNSLRQKRNPLLKPENSYGPLALVKRGFAQQSKTEEISSVRSQ
jgi:hypothetical protein